MNRENTSGKNRIPSVPVASRSVPAMNSYIISETDCTRLGTRPRPLVEKIRNAEVAATVKTMNREELVNEKSMPPTSIGKIFWIWNCEIGSFATGQPSSLVHNHCALGRDKFY